MSRATRLAILLSVAVILVMGLSFAPGRSDERRGSGADPQSVNELQGQLPPWSPPGFKGPTEGMALIPAGAYEMGCHAEPCFSDELPVHTVYIDAFYMDRYQVTNQQYAAALNWAWS